MTQAAAGPADKEPRPRHRAPPGAVRVGFRV